MKRSTPILAVLLALGTFPCNAHAQASVVPPLVNFQGRLVTPSGNPIPDGTYSVRFSLWDAVIAGSEKWNQTAGCSWRHKRQRQCPLQQLPTFL